METLQTERLFIQPITTHEAAFIFVLVNTPAWKRFIGDRHVHHIDDAIGYIQRVIDNPDTDFRVVCRQQDQQPLGIVTVIKRAYLPHHDIGFAFLPEHASQGYAFEAASALLEALKKDKTHTHILATTLPDNKRSIHLLEKLGLHYSETILYNGEELLLFEKLLA
ncbi:GNAT family N-acetyltransferase [Chitinophaga oryzae]|uniref:GNAT family N-acetyltransferase n=1 Tax=Chitinophaga oryzae TaxID=2725414 RepID=A0AAE6ZN78_9BACT|nr:GNAT family N-acetyltransferase [Chitinophaga oryzae]QJB35068.1 GNAT family N-acetyltransferase [Chitinophaga oryzae]QJB41585.1 GNAT family N-acetyltransferase [Chitinophaga oryzae]